MRNPYVANCNFKVETRSQKGVPRREFTSVGGSCKRERVSPLDSIFVFLSPFSIRSPSNPVCASLAGSLLQTGSWGDTASRKHPTGEFSFANLSRYASVRSRRRRTVGIQASGRKREFCICLRAPGSMAGAVCFLNVTEEWDVEDAVSFGAGGGRKLPKRCRGSPKRTIRRAELSIYNELGK